MYIITRVIPASNQLIHIHIIYSFLNLLYNIGIDDSVLLHAIKFTYSYTRSHTHSQPFTAIHTLTAIHFRAMMRLPLPASPAHLALAPYDHPPTKREHPTVFSLPIFQST